MQKFPGLVLFMLFSIQAFTQEPVIARILREKEVKTEFYEMSEAGGWVLFLPMDFGKATFSNSQEHAMRRLKEAQVSRIDLVYSDYPAGQDFSSLNKKRLETLKRAVPALFSSPETEFRKVRQTIAKTKEVAKGLQHGFFIYFRPKASASETRDELRKMKDMLKTPAPETDPDVVDTTTADLWDWRCSIMAMVDTFGILKDSSVTNWLKVPASVPRRITRYSIDEYLRDSIQPIIRRSDYAGWDSIYQVKFGEEDCPDMIIDYSFFQLADTTVSAVLNRHKWTGAMVVADVTGSMYPYAGQLLQWLKLNLTDKKQKQFLFFNDGDNKEDKAKVIGSTGGLYPVMTNNYDEVEKTIEKAMLAGCGGDGPENDIEALLEAEKRCGSCEGMVLIADNWAPVKDIALLSRLKKPVRVILCGVLGRIHPDYLKLARDTKGSIHLVEEDIMNLAEVKEGASIRIHGVNYTLIKGEFVPADSLKL